MPKGDYRGISLSKTLVDRIEEAIKDTSYKSIADFVTDCVREKLDSNNPSKYVAIPKPMIGAIDRVIEEYPQYLFVDRQKFVEQAVRELVLRVGLDASAALADSFIPPFSQHAKIVNDKLPEDKKRLVLRDIITEIATKRGLNLNDEQIEDGVDAMLRKEESTGS